MTVTLHQFRYSHYNEKARWALTWKGIRHRRISYLPGPHALYLRRLSGQQQTPVLDWDGDIIAGSAAIVDVLEERVPERPLQPDDADLRAEVAAERRHFDDTVGPAVRTALFSVLLEEGAYLCGLFAKGKPPTTQTLYRWSFPLLKRPVARANGVTGPVVVQRALDVCADALDRVADLAGRGSGQLVGETFTAADLTAAALLAPLVFPDHPDMALPAPVPARLQAFLARWADHPGTAWVRDQYVRFRG